jgi:hypothetical protein
VVLLIYFFTQIRDKRFPASSEKGRRLVQTLLLSPNAQLFVVARELRHAHSYDVVYRSMLTSGCVFMAYLWAFKLNRKLDLFSRPLKWRLSLYALLATMAGVIRLLLGDVLHYQADVSQHFFPHYLDLLSDDAVWN